MSLHMFLFVSIKPLPATPYRFRQHATYKMNSLGQIEKDIFYKENEKGGINVQWYERHEHI